MKLITWMLFSLAFLIQPRDCTSNMNTSGKPTKKGKKLAKMEKPFTREKQIALLQEGSSEQNATQTDDAVEKIEINTENDTDTVADTDADANTQQNEVIEELHYNGLNSVADTDTVADANTQQNGVIEGLHYNWLNSVRIPKANAAAAPTKVLTLQNTDSAKSYYQYGTNIYGHYKKGNKKFIVIKEENYPPIAFELLYTKNNNLTQLKFGQLRYKVRGLEPPKNPKKKANNDTRTTDEYLQHVLIKTQCECVVTDLQKLHTCNAMLGKKISNKVSKANAAAIKNSSDTTQIIKKVDLYRFFKKFHHGVISYQNRMSKSPTATKSNSLVQSIPNIPTPPVAPPLGSYTDSDERRTEEDTNDDEDLQ